MYLAEYEYEVLIGSKAVDDEAVGTINWVTRFYNDLRVCLDQKVGRKNVLRFYRLDHVPEIEAGLRNQILSRSATLIAILGASFHDPVDEYGAHWSRFAAPLGPEVNVTKLFQVFKTRCDYVPPPDHGRGYNFWSTEPNGVAVEYLHQGKLQQQIAELYALRDNVFATLRAMKEKEDSRPRVYLTGNWPGLEEFYDGLLAFLRPWCQVRTTPTGNPTDESFESAVREELERCTLSIHLFPDTLPLAAADPQTGVELRVARNLVQQRQIASIAWAPRYLQSASNDMVYGPLLLDFPENFEHLCAENDAGLRARIRARLARPLPGSKIMRLFFIVHQDDRPLIENMIRQLEQDTEGYKVTVSSEFDAAKYQLEDYREHLNDSDVAVICWANAPKSWFTRMQDTLLAHLGQDCNMSLRRCAVYCTESHLAFTTSFERVTGKSFSAHQLKPFLSGLRPPMAIAERR